MAKAALVPVEPVAFGAALCVASMTALVTPLVALVAAAAALIDVGVEIVLAVVDRDLLIRLDPLARDLDDAAAAADGLRVRPAVMVDVARLVETRRAVDGP